ncbi:MAG: transglutaminase-like domain-containing protein [Bacteroidales bacterium]|nr:transglutaminase-like domain-containing protein [Bacteroidales bacterium]
MKFARLLPSALLLVLSCSSPRNDCSEAIGRIGNHLAAGNLEGASALADSILALSHCDSTLLARADSLKQIAERIALDFALDETAVTARLRQRLGEFSPEQKDKWERDGLLEYRMLNGRKMYFTRSVTNLMLLLEFHAPPNENAATAPLDPDIKLRTRHTAEVLAAAAGNSSPVLPVTMEITYTLTVDPDAVPAGETIRCWLPFPASGHPRQGGIELLGTSVAEYIMAPDTAVHKTIYIEKQAAKGEPTGFSIKFRFTSSAQHFRYDGLKPLPYDLNSDLYRTYTSEQLPHICFTPGVKKLADSLAGNESDPSKVVRNIYMWFKDNIPWAGALEYSVMPNIPEYVLANRRGDCGMQTFLFMSMLRHRGIPVRWQSGWMLPPGGENLHDWCEVFYEGIGWVPADVSYDLIPSSDPVHREFYLSGLDSYRMIVNIGVAGDLFPPKRFLRSEPYDFQRGEVEWRGGNLYFDKWHYDIDIKYLQ